MKHLYNDGGRAAAGFKGTTGDCVVRAIAIATGQDYQTVYDDLFKAQKNFASTGRSARARNAAKNPSPRNGVHKPVYKNYLLELGWNWLPTMSIGSGCTVHLRSDELPSGRLIVCVSKHVTAVIDGVLQDTYDCSRNGTRCVYGYFMK